MISHTYAFFGVQVKPCELLGTLYIETISSEATLLSNVQRLFRKEVRSSERKCRAELIARDDIV